MQKVIPIDKDITLVRIHNQKQQAKMFLNLLKKNQQRLEPFFPGYYKDEISLKNIQNILKRKENQSQKKETDSYAICSKKEKRIIGEIFVSYTLIDANISYWIDKPLENQGIISNSFDKLRKKLFQDGILFLYADCDKQNKKSISFLKHKGLKKIASFKINPQRKFFQFTQSKVEYQMWKNIVQTQQKRS